MSANIEKVKAGLKLRTNAKSNALSLKIGVKKFVLPYEVRLIQSDEYMFVHVPPAAEIFRITPDGLQQVDSADEAAMATASFSRPRGRRRSTKAAAAEAELPTHVAAALKSVPPGYRIGYDASGTPRLIRTRTRRKKA